uniref:Uncharacterized protein n=1 Tax=Rhizophora mucronata TaxID=61149 RepID=A0A2P2PME7_RHIMU
MMIYSLIIILL